MIFLQCALAVALVVLLPPEEDFSVAYGGRRKDLPAPGPIAHSFGYNLFQVREERYYAERHHEWLVRLRPKVFYLPALCEEQLELWIAKQQDNCRAWQELHDALRDDLYDEYRWSSLLELSKRLDPVHWHLRIMPSPSPRNLPE